MDFHCKEASVFLLSLPFNTVWKFLPSFQSFSTSIIFTASLSSLAHCFIQFCLFDLKGELLERTDPAKMHVRRQRILLEKQMKAERELIRMECPCIEREKSCRDFLPFSLENSTQNTKQETRIHSKWIKG